MTDDEAHAYYSDPDHLRPTGPGRRRRSEREIIDQLVAERDRLKARCAELEHQLEVETNQRFAGHP